MTCLYWAMTASLLVWAKMVETSALTGLERAEPSLEVMVRAKRGAAALPGGSGKDRPDGGADAGVGVTGDQHDPGGILRGGDLEPPFAQGPQEGRPEIGGLGVAQGHVPGSRGGLRPTRRWPPPAPGRPPGAPLSRPGGWRLANRWGNQVRSRRRDRNSCTPSSISLQIRETVDLEIPDSLPRALTRSSTLRVETPSTPGGADHGASGPCPPAGGGGAGRGRTSRCEARGSRARPRRRWWPPSWASCRCGGWCAAACARSAARRSRRRPRRRPGPAARPGGRRRKTSS